VLEISVDESIIQADEKGLIKTTIPTRSLRGIFVLIVKGDTNLRSKLVIE